MKHFLLSSALLLFPLCAIPHLACAQGTASTVGTSSVTPATEVSRRNTAVTLNYCRAALHRIRRAPSKNVLVEEQQRILNNLDLNQIDDPEVIVLYRSILDEIGQVEISDRERKVIGEQFVRGAQRKMGTDFFVIGAQAATGQLGSVIQSGANSWWDYRSMEFQRDQDLLKIEKTRINSVVAKSSLFMDTFWKLAQKKKIPDRWLVRGNDLDALEVAMREPNPEVRLRVLKRMEDFMECYPPYWYYTGRTQQEQGQLAEAVETYQRLEKLGQLRESMDSAICPVRRNSQFS